MPELIPAAPAADWIPVAVFLVVGVVFTYVMLLIPRLLSPRRPTPAKSRPYECGERVSGEFWRQFHIGYYLFALVFIIFDVDVVFLWPLVRILKPVAEQGGPALFIFLDLFVFVGILAAAFAYAWKKGVLQWE